MVATNRTDIMLSLDVLVYVTSLFQRDVKEIPKSAQVKTISNMPTSSSHANLNPIKIVKIEFYQIS